jgi:hypothetical protein
MIKLAQKVLLILFLLLISSCITKFVPRTSEDKEILVVEGLITDQPVTYKLKLSRSLPLGERNASKPVTGCLVSISDDLGNVFNLKESVEGTYLTDSVQFRGITGRFYTLHIYTGSNSNFNNLTYESYPMEMKPVPPIDSIYYEKLAFKYGPDGITPTQEGCQVYLDTHDPTHKCKFFRWEYSETWEFHIPYTIPNYICWISNTSDVINIKNTSSLEESKVQRYPINFISNITDRLRVKYSILVNQYSMNEDEYLYWEKLENISQQVGGLYDIIPSVVSSNVSCLSDPNEKVLGYFSVSANSSKRAFIQGGFAGILTQYTNEACIADTAFGSEPVPSSAWVIINSFMPPYNVYTYTKGCADCTVRGTKTKPSFWQ